MVNTSGKHFKPVQHLKHLKHLNILKCASVSSVNENNYFWLNNTIIECREVKEMSEGLEVIDRAGKPNSDYCKDRFSVF